MVDLHGSERSHRVGGAPPGSGGPARHPESRWYARARLRSPAHPVVLLCAVVLAFAGCGGARQDADEPEGEFTLDIVKASFPAEQTVAQHTKMRLTVRNTDDRELPDLAVTVETQPAGGGKAPSAFGQAGSDVRLADANRPIWIVDREPEGGESAYTNTWALGRIAPGATKDIEWGLTAVRAGTYKINYRIAPGLNGKAVPANGQKVTGSFNVTVSDQPVPARVNGKGEVVRDKSGG
jgi:hypothetical protein